MGPQKSMDLSFPSLLADCMCSYEPIYFGLSIRNGMRPHMMMADVFKFSFFISFLFNHEEKGLMSNQLLCPFLTGKAKEGKERKEESERATSWRCVPRLFRCRQWNNELFGSLNEFPRSLRALAWRMWNSIIALANHKLGIPSSVPRGASIG